MSAKQIKIRLDEVERNHREQRQQYAQAVRDHDARQLEYVIRTLTSYRDEYRQLTAALDAARCAA